MGGLGLEGGSIEFASHYIRNRRLRHKVDAADHESTALEMSMESQVKLLYD
jgi:hypothetical protein